jgi:hypothetical protein
MEGKMKGVIEDIRCTECLILYLIDLLLVEINLGGMDDVIYHR